MKNELALSGEKIESIIYPEHLKNIGMIRGEYLIRELNKNVLLLETREYITKYVDHICLLYAPDDVWYRFSELTISESNALEGTKEVLPDKHPLFGMRGLRRHLYYQDEFIAEIDAVIQSSIKHKNLAVLLPFVNDASQLSEAIAILREQGFTGDIGCMIEVPSAYFDLEQILQTGITKIVIGMNDLTSFVFATVRNSEWHQIESMLMQRIIVDMYQQAQSRGVNMVVAGYLTASLVEMLNQKGIKCIVHYHQIPEMFGKDIQYPYHLSDIKQRTKKCIEQKGVE